MAIEQVSPTDYIKLAELWEDSVRTTHDFLSDADIAAMRPRLLAEWLPAVALRVYRGSEDRILGFIGLSEEKVEMLFVASNARGRGIGKRLLAHAVARQGARLVDVNEQNEQALGFYRRQGFVEFARSPLDGQGKPFPIIHMKLAQADGQGR